MNSNSTATAIFYGEVSPKTGNRYWIYDNYPFDQWNNLLTGEIHRRLGTAA